MDNTRENPDGSGIWTASTENGKASFQRIYPTKVTVDLRYGTPSFEEPLGKTHLSVAQAVQRIRDREIANVRAVLSALESLLLPQLSNKGSVLSYVNPDKDNAETKMTRL